MTKVIKLKESDLYRIIKRVLNEQESPKPFKVKKELIQLLEQNGFKLNTNWEIGVPTYTKITDKGEFSFIFSSYSNNTKFQFYVKNPSEDVIKSFLLKPTQTKGFYADAATLSPKKGWDYGDQIFLKKGEISTGVLQLKSYLNDIMINAKK